MGRRISPETYRRVIELLALGHSISKTSRLARTRYKAVERIAAGTSSRSGPLDHAAALADRCPGCGRKIFVWPCLECMMTSRRVTDG